eukprot:Clim_evm25s215 gene=Clim_evmTU25s215
MPNKEVEGAVNTWDVNLCETCVKVPAYWCCSFWTPCCFVCRQRIRILGGPNVWRDNYVCCGGICGNCCKACGNLDKKCPDVCLCIESFFCFWFATSGNRFLLQSTYKIRNTPLENCLLIFACICSWVRCIASFFIDLPQELEFLIDILYAMLASCMLSQQEAEIDFQTGTAGEIYCFTPYKNRVHERQPQPQPAAAGPPGYPGPPGGAPPPGYGDPNSQGGYPPQGYPAPKN